MAEKKFNMGKKGEFVVANREYEGKHYVDLRYYWQGFPTKKGVTFADVGEAEDIAKAVLDACKAVLEARRQAKEKESANVPAEEEMF